MDTGIMFLRIVSPFYFVVATKLVSDGILRGAGMMKKFMFATFTDLTLRVFLAEILSRTALGVTSVHRFLCGKIMPSLGLDLGSTTVKYVLLDSDSARLAATRRTSTVPSSSAAKMRSSSI